MGSGNSLPMLAMRVSSRRPNMSSIQSTAIPLRRTFLGRYLPLVVWMTFIWVGSSGSFSADNTSRFIGPLFLWLFPNASPETLTLVHGIVRKLAHFTGYFVLGLLAARAFRGSPRSAVSSRWFWSSAVLIVGYSLIDEYHQSFVPSRSSSIFDSFIDMAGGLTALLIVWKFDRRATRAGGRF
jgi:VanZ family protein